MLRAAQVRCTESPAELARRNSKEVEGMVGTDQWWISWVPGTFRKNKQTNTQPMSIIIIIIIRPR